MFLEHINYNILSISSVTSHHSLYLYPIFLGVAYFYFYMMFLL